MIPAYDKTYLEKARVALGRMLDFSVYSLKYDISVFFDLFIASGVAARFERGEFSVTVGRSGVELAYEVLDKAGIRYERVRPSYGAERSREYWTGWALAYYQWHTAMSFEEIIRHIPIAEISALYSPYHEMDIRQFVDKMDLLYRKAKPETNLKYMRLKRNLSQSELAKSSGVPLRTVQQYEQRQKNINKAQAETVLKLADALYCDARDLIEKI